MQTGTIILIILAVILALALSVYQYFHRTKSRSTPYRILFFLRFIAIFGILLLLINPKFTKEEYSIEKTNLVVLLDNSGSMNATNGSEDLETIKAELKSESNISERFNIDVYSFGGQLNSSDSTTFSENSTNIARTLSTLNEIYPKTNTAVVMVTDGNQTVGEDYEFYGARQKMPVYTVAVGDTTSYEDLGIDQVNSNRYAFLKNKYPMEVYLFYQGRNNVSSSLSISIDGSTVHRETITFSNISTSKLVSVLLDANSVGIKNIKIQLSPLEGERNTNNNVKNYAVEVIDEKTDIAIVSDLVHPDLGALKKSLESNEQRSVSLKKPSMSKAEMEEIDLFVIYQPTSSFNTLFEFIRERELNTFVVTGTKTDWNFLNDAQELYSVEDGYPDQEVLPIVNKGFSKFDISELDLAAFPPLESNAGDLNTIGTEETLLGMSIKGVQMSNPMFSMLQGENEVKNALLFGENIWKWRAQSFRNDQTFENFDSFLGKIIRYLSTDKARSRLTIDYKNTYEGSNDAKITATYFDETFVFDGNATVELELREVDNNSGRKIPMLLKNGFYEADLSGIPSGKYNFTVRVKNTDLSESGSFIILDFDIEQQFMSSNYKKLSRLSEATGGTLYFPLETEKLIADLNADPRFLPTQTSQQNIVSLVDFRVLLGIIAVALALEWFIRKYNGLI